MWVHSQAKCEYVRLHVQCRWTYETFKFISRLSKSFMQTQQQPMVQCLRIKCSPVTSIDGEIFSSGKLLRFFFRCCFVVSFHSTRFSSLQFYAANTSGSKYRISQIRFVAFFSIENVGSAELKLKISTVHMQWHNRQGANSKFENASPMRSVDNALTEWQMHPKPVAIR